MPTTAATIRLAPTSEPGGNLYNSYHLLTQISGLYAQAAQHDPRGAAGATWRELCDASVRDLGDLFHVWEAVLGDVKNGKAATIDAAVSTSVGRTCRRVAALSQALSVWTPMARWARLLGMLERRWQRYLAAFGAAGPQVKARLMPVEAGSRAREGKLAELVGAYRREAVHAASCFRLVAGDLAAPPPKKAVG